LGRLPRSPDLRGELGVDRHSGHGQAAHGNGSGRRCSGVIEILRAGPVGPEVQAVGTNICTGCPGEGLTRTRQLSARRRRSQGRRLGDCRVGNVDCFGDGAYGRVRRLQAEEIQRENEAEKKEERDLTRMPASDETVRAGVALNRGEMRIARRLIELSKVPFGRDVRNESSHLQSPLKTYSRTNPSPRMRPIRVSAELFSQRKVAGYRWR
jgi:hypothetical protein